MPKKKVTPEWKLTSQEINRVFALPLGLTERAKALCVEIPQIDGLAAGRGGEKIHRRIRERLPIVEAYYQRRLTEQVAKIGLGFVVPTLPGRSKPKKLYAFGEDGQLYELWGKMWRKAKKLSALLEEASEKQS